MYNTELNDFNMNFCPKCENLLYPKKNSLFCKFCGKFYEFKEGIIIKKTKNQNKKDINIKKPSIKIRHDDFDLNNSTIIQRFVNLSNQNLSYLHFFPYETFREEQEDILKKIENGGKNRNVMLLVAPNGTGKTVIALSGLLSVAIEKNLKIIYLCRTHSQNTRVIRELNKIASVLKIANLDHRINGISIRGRNEMCLNKSLLSLKLGPRDSMAVCGDLRKNRNCPYFLNLLKKRSEVDNTILLAPEIFYQPIDAELLINFCKDKNLCPYFLSKFLLEEMQVIICNYQWIFNPHIRESFLKFIGKELENCILIIDECHNLIDVATEVNSDKITQYLLKLCLKDLEMYRAPILMHSFVNLLLNHLEKKKKSIREEEKKINPAEFIQKLYIKLGFVDLNQFKNFIAELYDFSTSIHEERTANGEISRDFVGSLAEFWLKWLDTYLLDQYFFCYSVAEKSEKRNISLEIYALDPREISIPILKNCFTCLNLSGTVNPYVYSNLMGFYECGKKFTGIIGASPFEKKNIKAIITEGVDTRKENRSPIMYKKMIKKINEVVYSTPANIGIFTASYKILNGLLSNGLEDIIKRNNKKLFIEEPGSSASENFQLLDDFKSLASNKNGGAVLLGVCGGRNSEGEDYPGDLMNSVIIAGFPYHLPTPRVQAKIEYYDKVFNKQGWNFGYLYPAIQRANQASGRPIRKISDKGSIVFMDDRFKDKSKWISDWIRKVIEIVPDQENAITQHLYPFWYSK